MDGTTTESPLMADDSISVTRQISALADPPSPTSKPIKLPLSRTIEIEELPRRPASAQPVLSVPKFETILPSTPVKPAWRQQRSQMQPLTNSNSSKSNSSTAFRGQQQPRMTNTSLLSSAVAHATLERCLLGMNGGSHSTANGQDPDIQNYSKQCKPGHVIDLLELRRLSSRGVPDAPPEIRARSSMLRSYSGDEESHDGTMHTSSGNIQTPGGNPHRSYRPLVWRVLLGYLPPQTDLWNDVLTRDRRLYASLVKELFSSTCPQPHEVFGKEYLEAQVEAHLKGNQVHRTNDKAAISALGKEILKEGERTSVGNNDNQKMPLTPVGSMTEAVITTPVTPGTPGLLSARMQQEWGRGGDSIFTTPGSDNGSHVAGCGVLGTRMSPMCAMNTPRVSSWKQPLPASETLVEETSLEISAGSDRAEPVCATPLVMTSDPADERDNDEQNRMAGRLMNSLLLPDDDDDDSDEEEGVKNANLARNPLTNQELTSVAISKELRSSEARKVNEIHIDYNNAGNGGCTESGSDEGVELSRRSSHYDDHQVNGKAGTKEAPSMDMNEEENVTLLDEIRKDVIRTHPDLRFFLEPKEDLGQKRYAALERILFVWAKLNKGVRYVQGMNEIVGTLYFVLAHDSNDDWAHQAEADTYFLFNSLMVEMRDVFVPDLDEADTGIHGRISNMITLLSLHDPEVRCHLDEVGIDPSFYSVRWLTTLLSREFLLPDTIRLWDSMFASTHKDNFLRYVSVTMVMVIRDQLLVGDFSTCLRLLQAYPPTNLDRLLESSRALWIYESQITIACHKGGISLGHALRTIAPPPAIVMAYGLPRGVAPPLSEQVRQVGGRGLAAARGAANEASSTVASAGRSFFGFWRSGSGENRQKKDFRRSKTTM